MERRQFVKLTAKTVAGMSLANRSISAANTRSTVKAVVSNLFVYMDGNNEDISGWANVSKSEKRLFLDLTNVGLSMAKWAVKQQPNPVYLIGKYSREVDHVEFMVDEILRDSTDLDINI